MTVIYDVSKFNTIHKAKTTLIKQLSWKYLITDLVAVDNANGDVALTDHGEEVVHSIATNHFDQDKKRTNAEISDIVPELVYVLSMHYNINRG